ncbi:MAG: nuclear transport factor 2 family protein [candidate division Zixibacteria bacterium]|nr:nuclear transport factor 2 family protein [candidate division Zixibacteria bacterium]
MKLFLLIVTTMWILMIGCVHMKDFSNTEQEMRAIEKVIDNSIGWALTKDKDLLFNSLAQDSSFFIYHPDNASTIHGFEAFRNYTENVFMNEAFRATSYKIKDLKINLSLDGMVAWFSARLDDFGEWNGKPAGWKDVRWTGVLEKRKGYWVIVQMHFSFASDSKD